MVASMIRAAGTRSGANVRSRRSRHGSAASWALVSSARWGTLANHHVSPAGAVMEQKNARRPNAGKLFLDYLLSARAQTIMANQATLFSLREDVDGPHSAAALSKELGSRLKQRLESLREKAPEIVDIRGPGFMNAVQRHWLHGAVEPSFMPVRFCSE